MKLDRNNGKGGKYAVINMRKARKTMALERSYAGGKEEVAGALQVLANHGLINHGQPHSENEFFVIMLKDVNADTALTAYAMSAKDDDKEYSDDVMTLAKRSGINSKYCKNPD